MKLIKNTKSMPTNAGSDADPLTLSARMFKVKGRVRHLKRSEATPAIRENVMELLEEDLTCPICCSLFEDPRVLPCTHNFCKKCLEEIIDGGGRNIMWRPLPFKCPTCRKETTVTGANSLQVNYSLMGIVEKYNKIKTTPKMPVCKLHSGQPLNIFCSTDLRLICGYCATRGDHTEHAFCSIEDAYSQEKCAFETLFHGVETWSCGDILTRLDTLETSKKKELQLLAKDADRVKVYFEKQQQIFDQKKNELLSDFETMKLAVMQAYDPQINKLNLILHEQKRAFKIAEDFKDVSDPIVFLQQMQEFREKIRLIKETPLPSSMPTMISHSTKNIDTSQWDHMKLMDVDKLSLPQQSDTLSWRNRLTFAHTFATLSLICMLVLAIMMIAGVSALSNLDTLKIQVASVFSPGMVDTAEISKYMVVFWVQAGAGLDLLKEKCQDYTLMILEQVAEFVCKYKLL
ncbi:E3 ubiquitin-protein ligase TRIM13 isoform X2 [Pleurodeles waltl]|uniref:E3 ubiquitin-protein ligase TRIM13 isoform X2 n=1 Tax=Pleurodeles waltl TaxID=8319 RepID=UPI003709B5D2